MFSEKETSSGYLQCPLCDAEVPIDEDEKDGEQLFCPYCECTLRLRERNDNKFLTEDF
ncbi:MAG: hypothetical protein ACE5DR_00785 [Thermodesulfobacteriota bacterium]